MLAEGRGYVAPAPIEVHLPSNVLQMARREADRRAKFRGYARGRTAWKRGLIRNPIEVGLLGEMAFAMFVNRRMKYDLCSVDTALRTGGDKGVDFDILGMACQVKTSRIQRDSLYAKRVENGRIYPLVANVFVWVALHPEKAETASVLGWVTRFRLRQFALRQRSPIVRATHHNLVLHRKYLEPMSRLIVQLRGMRE